ncbi:hypothetical protein ACFOWX_04440 [Sphingorhabdus arenilitoris]|uniref:DUF202 domain-containing protein n=1 Tax=Sphingorhabdus arenilitoris TaxID=1490041 RepID=A0ABV8REL3_9SPHN
MNSQSLEQFVPQGQMVRIMGSILEYLTGLWNDHLWMIVAILAATTSLFSIFADRRRVKRINLEKVGFMPWTGISVLSIFITVAAIALTIKTEFGG